MGNVVLRYVRNDNILIFKTIIKQEKGTKKQHDLKF